MAASSARGLLSNSDNLETALLKPEEASKTLFNKILDQFAASSLFSSDLSPTVFMVYAHDNGEEGTAHEKCVRELITWLAKAHVQILSDQGPLPLLIPRIEGTGSISNILANQICLLPSPQDGSMKRKRTSVDKVIVCGSEVLEAYCRKPSAKAYIQDIVQVYTQYSEPPADSNLESRLRERVDKECQRGDFHHVLTELAFLMVRSPGLSEIPGLVPIMLSQFKPEEPPMRYLQFFSDTDVKLKLKSPELSDMHRLFFKLLEQVFPDNRDFIKCFKQCYIQINEEIERLLGQGESGIDFINIVNRGIAEAYHEYWKISCVLVRNGKLQGYMGKLSNCVLETLEHLDLLRYHEILEWLSPNPTSKQHGRFDDLETRRIKGTCDWVIQDKEFHRWHTCEGSALLYLCGQMGTGKTYATSRVVDWIEQGLSMNTNDEAFAFFYCIKQDAARSEPKEILRSIIRQLATGPWKKSITNPTIDKRIYKLWLNDRAKGNLSTFREWEDCLLALVDTFANTTIVLDALDETTTQHRQGLIDLFTKLATRSSDSKSVKVFVSSRPQVDISQHMDQHHIIRMEEKHNAGDIKVFIRERIAQHSEWSNMREEIQERLVETLSQKSQNMFLFAALQIDNLNDCCVIDDILDQVDKLPATLAAAYELIYKEATKRPAAKIVTDRALAWVMCSARPLTTDELLFAISQDPQSGRLSTSGHKASENSVARLCHNLLTREGNGDSGLHVWRLAHQAVAEFLQATDYCTLSVAHCEAGMVCLLLLNDTFGAKPTDSRIWNNAHEASEEEPICSCGRTSSDGPFHRQLPGTLADYAVYAWPTHIRAQNDGAARWDVSLLSHTLQSFLGAPEDGSPAYKGWVDHAFHSQNIGSMPAWSIFNARPMGHDYASSFVMAPILLACHLGIYTCLFDWWGSSAINYDQVFHAGKHWWPHHSTCENHLVVSSTYAWSLLALACAHKDTFLMEHLMGRVGKDLINPKAEDHMPPIVAAAGSGSVETVDNLIKRGAYICSPFTDRHGHVICFAIGSNSLEVLEFLIQQPGLSQATEIEEALISLDFRLFRSTQAMSILIDRGIDANTPLKVGTLLLAAASNNWEGIVACLMEKGAEVNASAYLDEYQGVLDALIFGNGSPSQEMITLFVERGAEVNSWDLINAWQWEKTAGAAFVHESGSLSSQLEKRKELFLMLLERKPDLDETWIDDLDGRTTSALIEAAIRCDLDLARLLLKHGANVNLKVRGRDVTLNAPSSAFSSALSSALFSPLDMHILQSEDRARAAIECLVEEGANLDNLEGDDLHSALAAAVLLGLEEMIHDLLSRGASPYAFLDAERWGVRTALTTAADPDSTNPRAPTIVLALLNHNPNAKGTYDYYVATQSALDWLLETISGIRSIRTPYPLEDWLKSASILAKNGAVSTFNFTQWNENLKSANPEFWSQNSETLRVLGEKLAQNRRSIVLHG